MSRSFTAIAAVLGFLFAVGCSGGANTANIVNTPQTNANSRLAAAPSVDPMATGRNLYDLNCAKCHKETGVGGPVEVDGKKLNPENLTKDKIKKFSDDKIIGYIRDGIEDEGMPSFKGKLSEAEMREVVRYVRIELQRLPEGANTNANSGTNANAK